MAGPECVERENPVFWQFSNERSLTWAGYDVNHPWGSGGHNQKHATAKEIKVNLRGDSKWRGYEVLGVGAEWELVNANFNDAPPTCPLPFLTSLRCGPRFRLQRS